MEKLFKYLDKIGADYKPEKIGYNYFTNVIPVVRDVAIVSFDYSGGSDRVRDVACQRDKIERYCKRYGYRIYNRCSVLGQSWFFVAKNSDYEAVSYMGEFVRRSVAACKKLNHLYRSGCTTIKSDSELNNKMKLIMDRFGREYKRMTFLVYGGVAV